MTVTMAMTNPLLIIGASLLLVANNDSWAFHQPPPLPSLKIRTGRQPSKHDRCIIGSKSIQARASPSSSDDEEVEGFEIRRDSSGQRSTPFRVETTFGAENVPVDFRPSNEYLNLIQQPTFAWASQETGDVGLVLRLAITYLVFFFLV